MRNYWNSKWDSWMTLNDCDTELYVDAKYPYDKVTNTIKAVVKSSLDMTSKSVINAIDKVIFSDPATIIKWKDGTKTVVKAQNEPFDKEKGLAMAIIKKFCGNKGNFSDIFRKYIDDEKTVTKNGKKKSSCKKNIRLNENK